MSSTESIAEIVERSKKYGDDVIGLLHMKIADANLTRDTDVVGQMDPFVELKIGGKLVHKTAVIDEGGKTPVWNEEFVYEVKDISPEVTFIVYDEDTFSNDFVGMGTCELADLCQDGGTNENYPIAFEGQSAGTIRFETSWVNFKVAKALYQHE